MNKSEVIALVDLILVQNGLEPYSSVAKINIAGERFGRLVVLSEADKKKAGSRRRWNCRCDCGTEREFDQRRLTSGQTVSCGCYAKEMSPKRHVSHGKSRDPEFRTTYVTWKNMKQRCMDPLSVNYKHYGGRGISICDRWLGLSGFENFLSDMGKRPEKKTLDRIDVNGNYEPSNCRWATAKEQGLNRRNTQSRR